MAQKQALTLLGLSLLIVVESLSVWRESTESRRESGSSCGRTTFSGDGVVETLLKKSLNQTRK